LGKDFIILFTRERWPAEGKQMKDYSYAEQIADWLIFGFKVFQVHNFRRYIARSSTTHEEVGVILTVLSQPEVSDNAIVVVFLAKKNVLRFEVSMHDAMAVHDLQTLENTFHGHLDLTRGEFVAGFDLIVKLPTL
jgi:hypothetical protein